MRELSLPQFLALMALVATLLFAAAFATGGPSGETSPPSVAEEKAVIREEP